MNIVSYRAGLMLVRIDIDDFNREFPWILGI